MAEVQDEDKWLYGDDPNAEPKEAKKKSPEPEKDKTEETSEAPPDKDTNVPESTDTEANGDVNETNAEDKDAEPAAEDDEAAEKNGEKAKDGNDDDSSSDDEPTVTIGKIVKQPDIMRPPPPTHRAAPTSGLKDEDFDSTGKINGVPATDYNLAELEEKPWRKPGADLSDYFNYGFTEDTWIKYCERQKAMRTNESGIGLTSLGINVSNRMMSSALPSNIPVSIVNENSKYATLRKPAGMPVLKKSGEDDSSNTTNTVNTIQVMTADRRTYSNKVLSGAQGGTYEEVDFGGNPYGNDFFSTPPPNFYNPPPPTAPWGSIPPNVPPPGWNPDGGLGAPPPVSLHRGGMGYFEEDSMGSFGRPSRSAKEEREMEKIRESIVESRDRGERESRHHRRRSRSRSKSRHKRARSKSRSRSPSHKHKRKKSKRDRETE